MEEQQPTPEMMHQGAAEMKNARQKLMHTVLELGKKAFDPEGSEESRAEGKKEFDDYIKNTKTLNALGALTILTRPGYAPPWLRPKLLEVLSLVPLREGGVRPTMEFVFALHPSSTLKTSEAAVPQKRGANITHEALNMASNLLSAPPSSVPPERWYSGTGPQLLELLDGNEGPELVRAASYIIGFGILGRKTSGAPGTAGWKYLAEPLLHGIKPLPNSKKDDTDGIIDLSKPRIIVKHEDLAASLRRLHSLAVSHPNPGLCKRLLSPLTLPLWALATWKHVSPTLAEKICKPAQELLTIYLKLAPAPELILFLVQGLGYSGGFDQKNPEWVYQGATSEEINIVDTRQRLGAGANQSRSQITLEEIDSKVAKLMDLVAANFSDAHIATAFLELLERWMKSARKLKGAEILVKRDEEENRDPLSQLIELKVLQAMMEKFPDNLATQPKHILHLVSEILAESGPESSNNNDDDDDDDDDEVTSVALSLVNMIITVPGFQKSRVNPTILSSIESSLDRLSHAPGASEISKTANNLRLLLLYRDELVDPTSAANVSAPTDRQVEDRKTYNLAISYITNSANPPPVRAEGLSLIASLITSQSPILDIPGILAILSSLISDADEYIYMRAITVYTLLASSHPRAVTKELLDHFIDAKERKSVDERLRFAEALSQVIERLGQTFTGQVAQEVSEGLLAVAGRRGRRPKTLARQEREAQAEERRKKEADEVWGGKVPDFSDPKEEEDKEEKKRNEILERIVEGWESRRGEEDVRVRTSALSVLRKGIEVNLLGMGAPGLVNRVVELAVGVLQMEKGVEKGILRRAAVLVVLGFVVALEGIKGRGERIGGMGFGSKAREDVKGTLRYVAATDEDGLVVQHAKDVLESLENWEVGSLIEPLQGEGGETTGGLGLGGVGIGEFKLRGLAVNPERGLVQEVEEGKDEEKEEAVVKGRPRIEEIE